LSSANIVVFQYVDLFYLKVRDTEAMITCG